MSSFFMLIYLYRDMMNNVENMLQFYKRYLFSCNFISKHPYKSSVYIEISTHVKNNKKCEQMFIYLLTKNNCSAIIDISKGENKRSIRDFG